MVIRKPSLSVNETRRLANIRSAASSRDNDRTEQKAIQSNPANSTFHEKAGSVTATQPLPPNRETASSITASDAAKSTSQIVNGTPSATQQSAAGSSGVAFDNSSNRRGPAQMVQVFVSALPPSAGVSPAFDILCRQYTPQKALQMILRRALEEYEEMLELGTVDDAARTYLKDEEASDNRFVYTSRMMPKTKLVIARAHFDPLGLESTRAFGRKLATAALAAFFAREVARRI